MTIALERSDRFFRRIFGYYVKEDGTISSSAFRKKSKKPDEDCSVYLEKMMESPNEHMKKAVGGQIPIQFPAAIPMDEQIETHPDPQPEEPSHWIMKIKTSDQCDKLALGSRLL